MKPRLLDRFCGAGGAAMGYHRAGFEVVGVDIEPQPRYPFEFVQADAMTFSAAGFDAQHASPPCQDHMQSPMQGQQVHGTGWMLPAIRRVMQADGIPWVIENVVGAPMRVDVELCGCMVDLPDVERKRWFETSWGLFLLMPSCWHPGPVMNTMRTAHGPWYRKHGRVPTRAEIAAGMGIDWMRGEEIKQAIPPAYTELIGREMLAILPARPSRCSGGLSGPTGCI